ncbi:hypothetical protein HGRIS_004104 [Hohenbuehelia grisea]|uniref:Uncharacterized protein n=1 Tax=Hohenbuehelia grisea TaxID=104357 RepID=A0ABR3JHG7_9AGAR
MLETCHSLALMDFLHDYFLHPSFFYGRGWADLVFDQVPLSLSLSDVFAVFVTMFVQSAYTLRVWHLSSRNKVLTGTIILLIAGAFATGLFSSAPLSAQSTSQVSYAYTGTSVRIPNLNHHHVH